MQRPTFLKLPPQAPTRIDETQHKENFRRKWFYNNQNISFVSYDNEQLTSLDNAMIKIKSSMAGRQLLQRIDSELRKKQLKISIHLKTNETAVKAYEDRYADSYRGTGSDFYCHLKQDNKIQGEEIIKENACIVFHELLHVLHNLEGKRLTNDDLNQSIHPFLLEEAKTVGLGKYSHGNLSENTFRRDIHSPRRTFYSHYNEVTINDNNTFTTKGINNEFRENPLPFLKKMK
ncbi:MAG: type III secretion system effector protein [Enterobacteriaceae bacterium]|jgi:hypothetical protein|nr:type III secretion system effector protein [Enterobacteriaceae bacterium]